MRLTKVSKRIVSLALTIAVAASSIAVAPAPKKAEAAAKYKAYLCLAAEGDDYYYKRTNHNDEGFVNYLTDANEKKVGGKFKDVTVKKSKKAATYTVSLTGIKKVLAGSAWRTLYVDTSIPGTDRDKIKVTKLVVKFDGKAVKTIKNPTITPDPNKTQDFTQIMALNTWNVYSEKKWSASAVKKVPNSKIEVSFTIKWK